jgi:hypothetical protein
LFINEHKPRHDKGLGLGPRFSKSPLDEQLVDTLAIHSAGVYRFEFENSTGVRLIRGNRKGYAGQFERI